MVNNCLEIISQTDFDFQPKYFTNSSQSSSLIITDQDLLLNYRCAFYSMTIGLNKICFQVYHYKFSLQQDRISSIPIANSLRGIGNLSIILTDVLCLIASNLIPLFIIEELLVNLFR